MLGFIQLELSDFFLVLLPKEFNPRDKAKGNFG
jgi:hypothetical protein